MGMRVMDLELRTWYGAPTYFVLGAMHAVLFWLSVSFLTPLVLLIACSTAAAACCTISCWEPWSSAARSAPMWRSRRERSETRVNRLTVLG